MRARALPTTHGAVPTIRKLGTTRHLEYIKAQVAAGSRTLRQPGRVGWSLTWHGPRPTTRDSAAHRPRSAHVGSQLLEVAERGHLGGRVEADEQLDERIQ
jgi:hypothetical protein